MAFEGILIFASALAGCQDPEQNIFYYDLNKVKYGRKRYEEICEEIGRMGKPSIVLTDLAAISLTNRMLWECSNVVGSICIDTEDPYPVEIGVKKKDYLLWDLQAGKAEEEDFAFMSGWTNSYNNKEFTQEELTEYIQDAYQKITPCINKESRLLEVGIGSGMIAYPLIPLCGQYDGCDFSGQMLDVLRERIRQSGFDHVNLYQKSADEIGEIPGVYDCILMSSVTEYFSGYNYMREVVRQCIDRIDETGEIFFLDIFDLRRLPDYKQSVAEYAKDHPDDNYKRSFQYELYIPREYWNSLRGSLAGIKEIKVTDKIGVIDNEINRYRYDVQVTVEKGRDVDGSRRYKPQFGVRRAGESVSLT
ncbi:MAG: class I SAM-dependent methyltransferase [Lachnospiraceae bacterium]|nr:class I SAM-dependent methyltransferase [Lachnospiraceae bacterium]